MGWNNIVLIYTKQGQESGFECIILTKFGVLTPFLTRECESNERIIAVGGNFTRSLDGL